MSYESFIAVAEECKGIDRPDLAFAVRCLAEEYRALQKKAHTLDEIVADAAEDEKLTYLSRAPQRQRFVPIVIVGGAA